VDVVLEGQLAADWSIKEVLQTISSLSNVELGVLRIASSASAVNGRLAVTRGRFVIGAKMTDTAESGYDAVRKLLSVQTGNFAFLDTSGAPPPDMDQSLHISIGRLLEALPELPAGPEELFDEKALLDEVFGATAAAAAGKRETSEILPAPAPEPEKQPPPPASWNIFKPLLGEDAQNTTPLLSGSGRITPNYAVDPSRTTFGRMRAYTDRLGPSGTALWLLVATLLVITCAAVGGMLFSRYNAGNQSQQQQR
jgi:hypothetical protein